MTAGSAVVMTNEKGQGKSSKVFEGGKEIHPEKKKATRQKGSQNYTSVSGHSA